MTTTIEGVRDALRHAGARAGGRFSLSLYTGDPLVSPDEASVFHWTRLGRFAPEEMHEVAHGSLEHCLAVLDGYAAEPDKAA